MTDNIQKSLVGQRLNDILINSNKKYEERTEYVSTIEKSVKTPSGLLFKPRTYEFSLDNFERVTDIEARFTVINDYNIGGTDYKRTRDTFFSPIQIDGKVKQKTAIELFGDVPMKDISFSVLKTDLYTKLWNIGVDPDMTNIVTEEIIFDRLIIELGVKTITTKDLAARKNLKFDLIQSEPNRTLFGKIFDDMLSKIYNAHNLETEYPTLIFGRANSKPWAPLTSKDSVILLKIQNVLSVIKLLYVYFEQISGEFTNLEKFLMVRYLRQNMLTDYINIEGTDSTRRVDLRTTTVVASIFMCLTVTDKKKGAYYIANKALKIFNPNFNPILFHDTNVKPFLENMNKMLHDKSIYDNFNVVFSSGSYINDDDVRKVQNGLFASFRRLCLTLKFQISLHDIERFRNNIADLKKLAAIDFSNFIDKITIKHDSHVDITLTRDQLVTLFGEKFIVTTSVVNKPRNSSYKCSMKLGVTSDFRLKDNEPLYFDPGRFKLKIDFKQDAHTKIFSSINAIESELAYTVEKRKLKPKMCITKTINERYGLVRVPIPGMYKIDIGPNLIPPDIKIPLTKYGESFILLVAVGKAGYSLTPNLDNLNDYCINIVESENMKSLKRDFPTMAIKYGMQQQTNNIVCNLNERETLFSGFDTKRQHNLIFNFEDTELSKRLPVSSIESTLIIPVVEYVVKYLEVGSAPKRTFLKLKTDENGHWVTK